VDLSQVIARGVAVLDPTVKDADEALGALARAASRELGVPAQVLHDGLRRRERLLPTVLPEGIALPHTILPEIPRTLVVPMFVPFGVQMATGERPSDIIIGLFGGPGDPNTHIRVLGRLARIATDLRALERLRSVPSADELVHVLLQFDAVHA
jgi:mannitol/fructose-specific phosphotransferase system IIA component (Ntr-type)